MEITALHCKYIASDIIKCCVCTLLPMNHLNMTKGDLNATMYV